MHPLRHYLSEVNESVQAFAERIGVSRQTLHKIMTGRHAPGPLIARRIVEATGGAITFSMIYEAGGGDVVALEPPEPPPLDADRLKRVFAAVVAHLRPDAAAPAPDMFEIAADAAIGAYAALSKVTTRRGPARLSQALRPVLEEILKETGPLPAPSSLDQGADLAAQLYLRDHAPR